MHLHLPVAGGDLGEVLGHHSDSLHRQSIAHHAGQRHHGAGHRPSPWRAEPLYLQWRLCFFRGIFGIPGWHSSHAMDQKTHQAYIGTPQTRTMEGMVRDLQLTDGQLSFPDHLPERSVSCCNHYAPQRRKANQRETHREDRLVDGGSKQQRVSPCESPNRQDFQ